ncbi:MAG: murein transglycosylase domain-containing protein [Bacteroidales bacterium]
MKQLITKIIPLFAFLLTGATPIAQAQTFEEYRKQQEEAFNNFKEENTRAYQEFAKLEKEGIERLKKELETYWGTHETRLSTQKEWVDYSEDMQSRSDVDFEGGIAKVEVLLEPEETGNTGTVREKVQSAVQNMIFNTCTTYDYGKDEKSGEGLLGEPVLEGQLVTLSGQPVSVKNADIFLEEVSAAENISYQEIEGADGQKRIKAQVTINLIPEHVQVRAMKFSEPVSLQASRFEMPRALIFAIIDTESSFNPMARSPVPAYGLMQIVPRFAGREAYHHLYRCDTLLSSDYLYNPRNNIELGTAYLDKLMNHYLKDIVDVQCRLLCSVAAYNTGTGNLYKAFRDAPAKKDVVAQINSMNYQQLLEFLHANLPYEETRNYVIKVDHKMKQYSHWHQNKE